MLRNPAEAEDAAQDVFVRVLCKIHTFRGEAAFSSWLYRLTTNLILMRFRKNHHRWMPLEEYKEDDSGSYSRISPPNGHPRDLLDRIDLQAAIDALPDGYKTAFILHEVRGYRHREIAAIFGYSVGNSKSQLHGARKHLRSLLGDAPEERAGQGTKLKSVCLSGNC
ncbi:MAG TPA: RNA polymerase sigma factor, partial [Candidatus Acidoferrum sp.]|nr:RNA polymerase sigma factor [Candidatus Acidoferrum sp.]